MKISELSTLQELSEKMIPEHLTVLKFHADWCGPCKVLGSIIDNMPEIENVDFYGVNVDEAEEEFLDRYPVRNIPVLVFIKNGLEVFKSVGLIGKNELEEKINELLAN